MAKKKWYNNFWIILIITLADIFLIPDPIPAIDEIILSYWTTKLGLKKKW